MRKRTTLTVFLFLIFGVSLGVRTNLAQVPGAPFVVSTNPSNGATGLPVNLNIVSITFSEPMQHGISLGGNWPPSTYSWSPDSTTLYMVRTDLQDLKTGTVISFTLNPGSYTNFRDLEGNPLLTFTFSFEIEENFKVIKFPANPAKGFYWPYYLSYPNGLGQNVRLLVQPNNSSTVSDDPAFHDQEAYELIRSTSWFAVNLGVPFLVPTFPRPQTFQVPEGGGLYTHALDRYSLWLPTVPENLRRVDLQLMAMINDARDRLAETGRAMDEKILIMGFSGSGAFSIRFTTLHPEIVKAVSPGAPGGWPTAPINDWEGITLRYPIGVADVEELTGQPFNLNAFRKVAKYIYAGDQDVNNALDVRDMPQEDKDKICALLTCGPYKIVNRWPIAQQMYKSAGVQGHFVIYPGAGHFYTPQMWDDRLTFFRSFVDPRDFLDVEESYWAEDYIDAIYSAGITAGCSQDNLDTPENEARFCPEDFVTREQMATFIIKAIEGEPPLDSCESGAPFTDVTPDMWSCRFIKRLKELGITKGYQEGRYGPTDLISREQMAVFLVTGIGNVPAEDYCNTGVPFTDVTADMWSCRFIKRLAMLGISLGYGDGRYGPYDAVTRAQMAVFLARAFLGMQ
jgi:hypothetical protein